VTDYHDRPWDGLRPGPEYRPHLFARRREFLLAHARSGDRALDLGCGVGDFTAVLWQAGAEAVGADASPLAIELARARHPGREFRVVPADDALPFASGAFDLVWLGGVIGHVLDTDAFLAEVARVLRPGGRLALSTEYHGRVKLLAVALGLLPHHLDPRGRHIRFYTRAALRAVLGDHGFEDLSIRTVDGPPLLRSTMLGAARRAG
jgi:SAM-dependent methyltransferase